MKLQLKVMTFLRLPGRVLLTYALQDRDFLTGDPSSTYGVKTLVVITNAKGISVRDGDGSIVAQNVEQQHITPVIFEEQVEPGCDGEDGALMEYVTSRRIREESKGSLGYVRRSRAPQKGVVYRHRWSTGAQDLVFVDHGAAKTWAFHEGLAYLPPANQMG